MGKLSRLEQYTEKRRQEVLLVLAEIDGNPDQIAVYRGFSSSLVQATAFDPDVPMLPESARILTIDRLLGPYDPQNPHYLEKALTWETIQPLLNEVGV
ncbi:MAG: hypothetical protein WCA35_11925 [Kovacikia sp.]